LTASRRGMSSRHIMLDGDEISHLLLLGTIFS
jgi:hypothetical protein